MLAPVEQNIRNHYGLPAIAILWRSSWQLQLLSPPRSHADIWQNIVCNSDVPLSKSTERIRHQSTKLICPLLRAEGLNHIDAGRASRRYRGRNHRCEQQHEGRAAHR